MCVHVSHGSPGKSGSPHWRCAPSPTTGRGRGHTESPLSSEGLVERRPCSPHRQRSPRYGNDPCSPPLPLLPPPRLRDTRCRGNRLQQLYKCACVWWGGGGGGGGDRQINVRIIMCVQFFAWRDGAAIHKIGEHFSTICKIIIYYNYCRKHSENG